MASSPMDPDALRAAPRRAAARSRSNGVLREAVERFARQHRESLILVPHAWAGGPSADGTLGVHRLTLVQFARQAALTRLAQLQLVPLSRLGAEALAAHVAFRAREADALSYFKPVAALPGFSRALARTLQDLRMAGVSPDQLNATDGAQTRDLAGLLEDYTRELGERGLADQAAILALARQSVQASDHRWAHIPLAILDLPLATRTERELIEALLDHAPQSFVAVSSLTDRLKPLLPAQIQDLDEATPQDSLAHLRRHLFEPSPRAYTPDDGRFALFSAPGENLEAMEIARRLHRLAREGFRFDEAAILLRNPERYQPLVEDAMRRAGIPAYFTRGAKRPDPGGRAFLALLACAAERLSASRFAEYVSLGQVPAQVASAPAQPEWVPPRDEALVPAAAAITAGQMSLFDETFIASLTLDSDQGQSPDHGGSPAGEDGAASSDLAPNRALDTTPPVPRRWEQYLVDAAVIGGRDRWERRLLGLEAEWALDAEANAERLVQLRHLRSFALPLIDALAQLPRTAAWKDWLPALRDLAQRSLRDPEGVLTTLAELEPMSEVGPTSLEEVMETLSDRLRFLRKEPPERPWGRVFVGAIDDARGRDFRVVFLPGLAEGLFPQRLSEDPLLLDESRGGVSPELPLRHDSVIEERERLHLAVGAARERLIASYPRMEVAEARPRVPSFYALELPRAIFGGVPELSVFEARAREAAPARLNWPAPRDTASAVDDAEYDLAAIGHKSAQHVLHANSTAARSLRARWKRWHAKWVSEDGLIASGEPGLAALATQGLLEREWSPSTLETFAACPYKFALRGIFHLREREQPIALEQLDPRTRGSLFHEIQSKLYAELQEAGELPVTADNLHAAMTRLELVLARVASAYEEKLAPAIPRVWSAEIEDLRTDLRGWLHFTAKNEFDWTPVEFEREFPRTSNGIYLDRIRLKGRIDAVEQSGGRLRVTDYKTGKPPETIPRWVGGGQHLQPLLYAVAAEAEFEKPVSTGRLFYATQRGGYLAVEIAVDQRARLFLAKLLDNLDGMIHGGFLPPAPAKDACKLCDYRVICGPYEERRFSKKDVRDEKLDALFEIRGMA